MSERILNIICFQVICFFFFSCHENSKVTISPIINKTDTSNFAILKFQQSNNWVLKNVKASTLSYIELLQLDSILKLCIDQYNKKQRLIFDSLTVRNNQTNLLLSDFIIDLEKYKRQYMPVINSKEDKEVWVNGFCDDWCKDWRKEVLIVHDGGNCYFNVIINLSSLSYRFFIVNGEA